MKILSSPLASKALFAAALMSVGTFTSLHGAQAETQAMAAKGPKVLGHKFVMPKTSLAKPVTTPQKKKAALKVTSAAKTGKVVTPKFLAGMPKGKKTRGQSVSPSGVAAGYRGLGSIFQYTNDGAPDRNRACGQAAVATILTYYGVKPQDTGYSVINEVYRRYSPDIAGGILGTSWQRVGSALGGYGVPYNWYSGEAGLKNALSLNKPCIVMLDVGAIPEEGWKSWGGHWVVAYGYDSQNVYLTNWNGYGPNNYADGGKCTWAAFNKAWNTWLTQSNGTPNKFLCPKG